MSGSPWLTCHSCSRRAASEQRTQSAQYITLYSGIAAASSPGWTCRAPVAQFAEIQGSICMMSNEKWEQAQMLSIRLPHQGHPLQH